MADKPLYTFTSHINGKNAKVSIWPDRVDWSRGGISGGKVLAAGLTFGVSALVTGGVKHSTSEMIPVKSITSVTSKKGMGTNTVVSVITSGNTIDFRVSHKEAAIIKDTLNKLIAGQPAAAPAAPAVPVAAAPNIGDQLQQLAGLRDAGVLTEEEFAAKKTELLSRM